VQTTLSPIRSWNHLLSESAPHSHFLQFYHADERPLVRNVGRFLCEGLNQGDHLILISTKEHTASFTDELAVLNAGVDAARRDGKLVCLDARETLAQFMVDGRPDAERFRSVIGSLLLRFSSNAGGVRAYGEMVNVLWKDGLTAVALRLEQLWNDLLRDFEFSLYCAYQVDIFDGRVAMADLNAVLCNHTHLLPGSDQDAEAAITAAMRDVIWFRAEVVRREIQSGYRPSWADMPRAEAFVFWLKNNLPHRAAEILARARQNYSVA